MATNLHEIQKTKNTHDAAEFPINVLVLSGDRNPARSIEAGEALRVSGIRPGWTRSPCAPLALAVSRRQAGRDHRRLVRTFQAGASAHTRINARVYESPAR